MGVAFVQGLAGVTDCVAAGGGGRPRSGLPFRQAQGPELVEGRAGRGLSDGLLCRRRQTVLGAAVDHIPEHEGHHACEQDEQDDDFLVAAHGGKLFRTQPSASAITPGEPALRFQQTRGKFPA